MKVAIVGAGFSGIATAKILLEFGHEVTIFERSADIGGVWSTARTYPGLTTQNTKNTYYLSDMPMPAHYPTFPSGQQVQAYLESYADKHDLWRMIRLRTGVTRVEPLEKDAGWRVTANAAGAADADEYCGEFDHLVVCNGVFSECEMPQFPGQEVFNGTIIHSSQFGDLADAASAGKHAVVLGYGKSSCDVAYALSTTGRAASTTVVARQLIWKLPRKILNFLPYQYLLLTRFGESLFEYIRPASFIERFLANSGSWLRNGMLNSLQSAITFQLRLRQTGLVPPGPFEEIARSTISLSTEGLYDKVAQGDGRVRIVRDATIVRLTSNNTALLSTGEEIPCDLLICATGFKQAAPFLPPRIRSQLTDSAGNWLLYKHILPIGVPNISFNGYNSSLFCPTSSEAAALVIATLISSSSSSSSSYSHHGSFLKLPFEEEQRREVLEDLAWLGRRSAGRHAHNTSVVPFSLHTIDELLGMVGVNISWWARLRQWLLPVRPSDYAGLSRILLNKIKSTSP